MKLKLAVAVASTLSLASLTIQADQSMLPSTSNAVAVVVGMDVTPLETAQPAAESPVVEQPAVQVTDIDSSDADKSEINKTGTENPPG